MAQSWARSGFEGLGQSRITGDRIKKVSQAVVTAVWVVDCTNPLPVPRLPDLGMVSAKAGPCSSPWISAVTEIRTKGSRNISEKAMVSGSVCMCVCACTAWGDKCQY